MKRTALVRRTPLKPGKPLQSRTELRRTPINQISAKRAVQNRVRVISERDLGRRDGFGSCARCGEFTYVNGHERRKRSQGGDPARPDCLLCIACNEWCARELRLACWTGWAVSPKYPHDHTLENGQARDLAGNLVIFGADAPVDGAA